LIPIVKNGLKTAFYRVDENSMIWFNEMKKRKLLIGQEAIVDVTKFSLKEGIKNPCATIE